ncbi:MAG: hypothetical protein KDK78_03910, partial [Chlamydiia bacterium]|nr:hypothetical protein [Chlamydiia bacterium]
MPRKQRRRITIALASLAALFLIQILNFVQQIPLPASKEPARFYSNQVGDDLEALYSQVIDRAKHSILLVIYSLSDPTVLDALNRKAEEGISVTVLYDAEASRSIKRELHPKISATARNSKGLMHQKILVIDSEEVWIGSANMTRASLRHHANLCMGVHAPLLAEHITHRADLMRHRSEIAPASATRFLFEQQEFELWWLPNEAALDRLVSLIHGAQKTVRVAMYTWTHPRLSAACIEAQRRGVDVRIVIDGEAAAGAGAA